MSILELDRRTGAPPRHASADQPTPRAALGGFGLRLEELGELVPIGRPGGQGRVYRPAAVQGVRAAAPVVVKIYRRPPPAATVQSLAAMMRWGQSLQDEVRLHLHDVAAWPVAVVTKAGTPVGIGMQDVSGRFEVPFLMPSGRRQRVLLSLEHLLGSDDYLMLRGLSVRLDTAVRARVAERISAALAFLHRHAVVASDIAPNNLLVGFGDLGPEVCFIDCDSMVFRGRQALPPVETADWQMPSQFSEPPRTRAADAYKLGLIVLRLFARSHDARTLPSDGGSVPDGLRDLLRRALSSEPANRPPAGEWQRAVRVLIAQGGLSERVGSIHRAAVRRAPQREPRPREPAPPAPGPPPSRGSPHRNPAPMTLAWVVIAAVMFWLALARLFPSAEPAAGGTSLNEPPANGPQYYYQPAAPDFGR